MRDEPGEPGRTWTIHIWTGMVLLGVLIIASVLWQYSLISPDAWWKLLCLCIAGYVGFHVWPPLALFGVFIVASLLCRYHVVSPDAWREMLWLCVACLLGYLWGRKAGERCGLNDASQHETDVHGESTDLP